MVALLITIFFLFHYILFNLDLLSLTKALSTMADVYAPLRCGISSVLRLGFARPSRLKHRNRSLQALKWTSQRIFRATPSFVDIRSGCTPPRHISSCAHRALHTVSSRHLLQFDADMR